MTDPFVRKPSWRSHPIRRADPSDSCPLTLMWSFRLQGYRVSRAGVTRRNCLALTPPWPRNPAW